ncbi:hypothetical protein NA56DRAFT_671044 [Hyaloscypha hepaticicola]|uniref:Dienelactone hydrolase domain-containing protein n=1 Tax=Hyaloscypha hepaticicola TaxID=2082293 RepID=A0A2J6Q4P6_9HELO|nr:hypothetical protein NA56DRAFT_671044 [Hyaloscypha hepaticicola]
MGTGHCLSGSIKDAKPTGTVTTIHGLPTYVARPEGAPKGLELSNSRLLADAYTKKGEFLVYLPNFMNGFIPSAGVMHAMDSFLAPSPSVFTTIFYKPIWLFHFIGAAIPFLVFNRESAVKPNVFKFHEALRNDPETKSLKIGSAGFCWGGGYTIHLAQEPNLIDVGFTAHPSRMKFPEEWDKVQKPLSVAIGDVDMGIKIDMVKDIKTLLEGETKPKGQNEVVIYQGAKHGFAVRADPKDEGQTKSAEEAMTQAVAWFTKWMV